MKNLFLFVCLATLFACNKDDKKPIAPTLEEGTYESDGKISTSDHPLSMFITNKVITDTAVINSYVRRKWTNNPFYKGTDHDTMNYRQTLIFKGDSVIVRNSTGAATKIYDVKLNDTGISSFIERDSIEGGYDSSPAPLTCDNIARKIQADLPEFDCQTNTGNNNYHCIARQVWPFALIDGRIFRPLLRYTFDRTLNGGACSFSQFDIPVFFHQSVSTALQTGDTLLVQVGTYFLYKK